MIDKKHYRQHPDRRTVKNGGAMKEQTGWDGHAEFIDALVERGTMVMGGPFSDNSGSMVLLEGVDAAAPSA